MALDKEDILTLAEALRSADPRELAKREELIASRNARREKLEKDTKKTKTHAFYKVTANGFVTGIGRVQPGQKIALPLSMKPSHTWEAVDPNEDTVEVEPVPEKPKGPAAMRVPEKPKGPGKQTRAADEEA